MRHACGLLVAGLLLSGCAPASPDTATYDAKAAQTLGSAVSETRTVQRVLETLYDGRMLRSTAVVQLRSSENSLGTAARQFSELNPPTTRDTLTGRVGRLLDAAESAMADSRVAVHRRERDELPRLAGRLATVARRMESIEGRVQ